jgi:hypothetical protein
MNKVLLINDPVKLYNSQVTSWLLVCKYNAFANRYISLDIKKKIHSYLTIDLSEEFYNEDGEVFRFELVFDKYFWTRMPTNQSWMNPCHVCLLPCYEIEIYNSEYFGLTIMCSKHDLLYKSKIKADGNIRETENFTACDKCYPYGMCKECVESKYKSNFIC